MGYPASGYMRGLATGFFAFDNQNIRAALAKRDRQRQSDDAAADDDYVPGLHTGILEERRES
jgi:hypothetical protein